MKQVLVTGGAGFIGSHVVRCLLDAGHRVRVLVLPSERAMALDGLDVQRFVGDVREPRSVLAATRGCDWVFHLAALYALWTRRPSILREINVGGTRNVLQAARTAGVERVVYTSSIAVFGGQGPGRDATEESPYQLGQTGDVYAQTKYEAHQVALEYAARGLDVTLVAPTGPLGPGDRGPTPTGKLLLSAFHLPVPVLVAGEANVGDVRDMARGHLLAAERGRTGECYLLGQENVRYTDLVRRLLTLAGVSKPVLELPAGVLMGPARAALSWSRLTGRPPLFTPAAIRIARLGLRADCSKAARELGLPTRPLDDTLRDALDWFVRAGRLRLDMIHR